MGWCSATEIMDAAVAAADAAVTAVVEGVRAQFDEQAPGMVQNLEPVQSAIDESIGSFVATIAGQLRDSDWDCIEESAYFDRFPQEMLGYDDKRYAKYLQDILVDLEPGEPQFSETVAKLHEVNARMEGATDGG